MPVFNLIRNLVVLPVLLITAAAGAQTGNRVFAGAEMVNFGSISLSTPAGKTWSTVRSATPGYFSATNGATYTNASDANNINGYVKKYGNQAFTFPVGDGTDLRTLSISAPTSATDAYATAWILGDPSGNLDPTGPNGGMHDVTAVTFPIYAVSRVGQWDWQVGANMGATGDGVNLMITVSIPDMTAFALTPNLRLVGWNGSSWVDLSGMSTATGNTENSTLFGYMQAGISAVAIGSSWWVLPVKLLSFTGQSADCDARLRWTAENEENFSHYDVESSTNGISFQKIAAVQAKAGTTRNEYSYLASQPLQEAYYRLKMINNDGSFTYSATAYVKNSCEAPKTTVTLFPNPATGDAVTISIRSQAAQKAVLLITADNGQVLARRTVQLPAGASLVQQDLRQWPTGIYFVSVTDEMGKPMATTKKLIIQ